jgi:hypothetical protein
MQLASVTALLFGIYIAMKFRFTAFSWQNTRIHQEFLYLTSVVIFMVVFVLVCWEGYWKTVESADMSLMNKLFGVFQSC